MKWKQTPISFDKPKPEGEKLQIKTVSDYLEK